MPAKKTKKTPPQKPKSRTKKTTTTPRSKKNLDTDVLVIGGGLAGLTVAAGLIGSGLRTLVLEGSSRLGGRAQSWIDKKTGDPIHIGPHIFLSEYNNMFALMDLAGATGRVIWQDAQDLAVYDGTYWKAAPTAPLPPPLHFAPTMLTDKTVTQVDILRNLRVTLLAMQATEDDLMRLDNINASAFLRNMGVTENMIRQFWSFASMSILNVPPELCSAGALLRFYRHLIGHREVAYGFPDGGLGDVFAPGAQSAIEADGGQIMLNTGVKELIIEGSKAVGATLDDGRIVTAKHVVAALPPNALRRIIPRSWIRRGPFKDLVYFEPCPYVSTYLWFDRKVTDMKFWARTHDPNDLNCDFYDYSNILTDKKRDYSFITTNCIYSGRADALSDEEMVEETLKELYENIPEARNAKVVHSLVNRIDMAIHCPFPGTEQRRAPMQTPITELYLAGDWVKTGMPSCMEGACYSGWKVAEMLWATLGVQKELAKELPPVEGLVRLAEDVTKGLHLPHIPGWLRPTQPVRRPRKIPEGARMIWD